MYSIPHLRLLLTTNSIVKTKVSNGKTMHILSTNSNTTVI